MTPNKEFWVTESVSKSNLKIIALQETRRPSDMIEVNGWAYYFGECSPNSQAGTGFLVFSDWKGKVCNFCSISADFRTLISSFQVCLRCYSCYAPTNTASGLLQVEDFYDILDEETDKIDEKMGCITLGDFNVVIGTRSTSTRRVGIWSDKCTIFESLTHSSVTKEVKDGLSRGRIMNKKLHLTIVL